jgi:hypothetical protein
MVARLFDARDALLTFNVAKGSEARCDLVAQRLGFRFQDDPIPLPPADVESNEPGAV